MTNPDHSTHASETCLIVVLIVFVLLVLGALAFVAEAY